MLIEVVIFLAGLITFIYKSTFFWQIREFFINKNIHSTNIHKINVKVSNTPDELRKGLMFVKHLAENEGMLFKYPNLGKHTFWMQNTYIPLDVIYFDNDYNVIGFIEDNQPHNLTIRGINAESKSFLEVNSGYVKKNNVRIGDKFIFTSLNV